MVRYEIWCGGSGEVCGEVFASDVIQAINAFERAYGNDFAINFEKGVYANISKNQGPMVKLYFR